MSTDVTHVLMDLYSVLQVPPSATADDIKKAYRKLSMIHHPDKNKGNPEATAMFQKVSEAYQVLSMTHNATHLTYCFRRKM